MQTTTETCRRQFVLTSADWLRLSAAFWQWIGWELIIKLSPVCLIVILVIPCHTAIVVIETGFPPLSDLCSSFVIESGCREVAARSESLCSWWKIFKAITTDDVYFIYLIFSLVGGWWTIFTLVWLSHKWERIIEFWAKSQKTNKTKYPNLRTV